MIVTAVERKRYRRQVSVFIDGRFVLTLAARLAQEREIRPGRELTERELEELSTEEARRSAVESALRLLSYRPRSERELRDRLARKGVAADVIDHALARMRALGYVDDAAFARFWTETRQASQPRSRRLLAQELRRRGISQSNADEAIEGVEDDETAYEAAHRRMRRMIGLEYGQFRERLGAFLTRRGFSYSVARRTIQRCWDELQEGDPVPLE